MRRVDHEIVSLHVRKQRLDRREDRLARAVERQRRRIGQGCLGDEQRRPGDAARLARPLEVDERSRRVGAAVRPRREEERLVAEGVGQALVAHDDRDDEAPLGRQEMGQRRQLAPGRVEVARPVEQRARRVIGDDEADAGGRLVPVDDHAGHPAALLHDARGALAEPGLASVSAQAFDEEVDELLFAPREARDAARPGPVQPAQREVRQVDGVAREAGRDVDDRAVLVVTGELAEKGRRPRSIHPEERRRRALPVSRRSQKVPGGQTRSFSKAASAAAFVRRELGVQMVYDAPHLRVHAIDLLAEELDVRGHLEAELGREHVEHGVERRRAAPEGLRLRELDEHPGPRRRRPREKDERPPREGHAVELVGRRPPSLPEDEDAPRPPGQQHRCGQRADARAENSHVVMLRQSPLLLHVYLGLRLRRINEPSGPADAAQTPRMRPRARLPAVRLEAPR